MKKKTLRKERIEFAQKFIYFAKRFGQQNNWTVEKDLLDWFESKLLEEHKKGVLSGLNWADREDLIEEYKSLNQNTK